MKYFFWCVYASCVIFIREKYVVTQNEKIAYSFIYIVITFFIIAFFNKLSKNEKNHVEKKDSGDF
ncbi:MAG: hypothetical protein EAZ81_11760 [Verrucomicrobia bacterium]|jgi:hypothetical protein|nr:MAG: hypothetical protein EAZ81_11760 [Verrucomicrobiota bacterium]